MKCGEWNSVGSNAVPQGWLTGLGEDAANVRQGRSPNASLSSSWLTQSAGGILILVLNLPTNIY